MESGHTVDVSTNVYNKVRLERQFASVQALDNALQTHASLRRASQLPLAFESP